MDKNYELLLKNITFEKDVSKYFFYGIEEELEKFFYILSDDEYDILIYRYALDGSNFKTLCEVAEEFGISEEKVRNMEKMIFRKLRLLFGLNKNSFVFNPDVLIEDAGKMLEAQQFYDSYYATDKGEKESATTKYYKRVIEIAQSFKKDKKRVLKLEKANLHKM